VALDVTVFNNTGVGIEVITDHSSGKVDANQFDDFRFPTRRGTGAFELLRIAAGGCEYLCDLDRATYSDEEWKDVVATGRGIQVQVEKDLCIAYEEPERAREADKVEHGEGGWMG